MKLVNILNNYIETYKFLLGIDNERKKIISSYEDELQKVAASQVNVTQAETLFLAYEPVKSFETKVEKIRSEFSEAEALLKPYLEAVKGKSLRYERNFEEIYYLSLIDQKVNIVKS